MKKAGLIFLMALIIAVAVGAIVFLSLPEASYSSQQNNFSNNSLLNQSGNFTQKISLSELKTHNKESDCWVSYEEKVYDLTAWLPIHPGSAAAISPYCGTAEEFENAFEGQHGTSKVETLKSMGTYKGDLE